MSLPDIHALYAATDTTWPSASISEIGGWIIKDGAGGGKRVSAAIQIDPTANIETAETAMRTIGQDQLFQIRTGEEQLDSRLQERGYQLFDPVVLLVAPVADLQKLNCDQLTTTPNADMIKIWADGGIGPSRLNVMARANCPKAYIHFDNKAVAYAAIHNGICMAHAVEVSEDHRRQGLGKQIMHRVADWANLQGAEFLAVITVIENIAARTLYKNLGMSEVGNYHYRIKR